MIRKPTACSKSPSAIANACSACLGEYPIATSSSTFAMTNDDEDDDEEAISHSMMIVVMLIQGEEEEVEIFDRARGESERRGTNDEYCQPSLGTGVFVEVSRWMSSRENESNRNVQISPLRPCRPPPRSVFDLFRPGRGRSPLQHDPGSARQFT